MKFLHGDQITFPRDHKDLDEGGNQHAIRGAITFPRDHKDLDEGMRCALTKLIGRMLCQVRVDNLHIAIVLAQIPICASRRIINRAIAVNVEVVSLSRLIGHLAR